MGLAHEEPKTATSSEPSSTKTNSPLEDPPESPAIKTSALTISFTPGPLKDDPESTTDEEDFMEHTTPSPKPVVKKDTPKKLSVQQRKSKLEENIRNRNKNLKELAKEKAESRSISRNCEKKRESKAK